MQRYIVALEGNPSLPLYEISVVHCRKFHGYSPVRSTRSVKQIELVGRLNNGFYDSKIFEFHNVTNVVPVIKIIHEAKIIKEFKGAINPIELSEFLRNKIDYLKAKQ